jgi:hypothetical protein
MDAPDVPDVPTGLDAPDVPTGLDASRDIAPDVTPDAADASPPLSPACVAAAAAHSYMGCEYWPVTLNNIVDQGDGMGDPGFTFAVSIANPQTVDVRVEITGGGLTAPRRFTIAAGATHTEALPWVWRLSLAGASSVVPGGAYHVVSDAPVVAYQFSPLEYDRVTPTGVRVFSYSNDASLLLPAHVLTRDYLGISWPTDSGGGAGLLTIAATSPGATTVDVRLAGAIRSDPTGIPPAAAGSMVTFTLNQGDVLQLLSDRHTGDCAGADLTGSVVHASRPVAAFGGHEGAFVPCGRPWADHLEEQLIPVDAWGTRYVVSALRERGATETSVIRIVSAHAGNRLTFDGIGYPTECPATLAAGAFCEFTTAADFVVSGSEPLAVAQYMVGQDVIAGTSGGDPAMVLEVPTFQFRDSYHIFVPATYVTNFLTIVHPRGTPPDLDGVPIAAGAPVGACGFAVARMTVTAGAHRLAGRSFGIKVSGVAPYTSYLYPGGLDIAPNGSSPRDF